MDPSLQVPATENRLVPPWFTMTAAGVMTMPATLGGCTEMVTEAESLRPWATDATLT